MWIGLLVLGALAGALGALLGIGGGVLLVPALTFLLDLPMDEAVLLSLLCVVATSVASTQGLLANGLTDLRLGVVLELASIPGALTGGAVAALLHPEWVSALFALFVFGVALQLLRAAWARPHVTDERLALSRRRWSLGLIGAYLAGVVSSVLGVGGGPLKVPLMALGLRVPFKVAASTSTFMVGMTAVASAATYQARGVPLRLEPLVPLLLGAALGSGVGTRLLVRVRARHAQVVLAALLIGIGISMLQRAVRATLGGST